MLQDSCSIEPTKLLIFLKIDNQELQQDLALHTQKNDREL